MINQRILPGLNITLGVTITYLAFVVLIPLCFLGLNVASMDFARFIKIITSDRFIAACKLTFSCALIAALINTIFGVMISYVLVRYEFLGKRFIDAMIDLPFALPTSVAGITLAALYSHDGFIGKFLGKYGIKIAYTPAGIVIALIFIGIPFVVRTVEPVLKDFEKEQEEAASTLGASRIQIFFKIIIPTLTPAIISGFGMAFARGIGEYGSVIFIAGNIPKYTEVVSQLIAIQLEQYDYHAASAIALVMLVISLSLLLLLSKIGNKG